MSQYYKITGTLEVVRSWIDVTSLNQKLMPAADHKLCHNAHLQTSMGYPFYSKSKYSAEEITQRYERMRNFRHCTL
jgi:hypothetical protein